MMRRAFCSVLLCACGESAQTSPAAPPEEPFVPPACAADPGPRCEDLEGFAYCAGSTGYPFLDAAISSYDAASSATLSVPEPGTLCLRGTLAPAGAQETWAELVLGLSPRGREGNCILAPFDARQLGISRVEFVLDAVPNTRMIVTMAVIQKTDCTDPFDCVAGGVYTLLSHDREDLVLGRPGLNRAPLEDFVGNDLTVPLDTSRLSLLSLRLVPTDRALDFGFCASDLAFVDADGRRVVPPALP